MSKKRTVNVTVYVQQAYEATFSTEMTDEEIKQVIKNNEGCGIGNLEDELDVEFSDECISQNYPLSNESYITEF